MLKKKNAHKAKSAKQTKSCCVRLTKSGSRFRTQSQSPISSCARTFARRAAASAAAAAFDWQPEWLTHAADVGAGQARVREHPQLVSLQLVASHTSRRRIVSVALRCVALHVKFSSLRWKFKSKEMQIRMWMRLRIRMWVWLWIWVRSGLCGTHLIMIHHSAKRGDEGTGTLLLFRCLLERLLRLL